MCESQGLWHCALQVPLSLRNPAICIPSCKCYDNISVSDYSRIHSKPRWGESLTRLCFTWVGIEWTFLNPQEVRGKFAKKPKWIQTCPRCSKSLLLQVRVWVSVCVGTVHSCPDIPCFYVDLEGCKWQGSQVGAGAHSDVIEFIKVKSYLWFLWRSHVGSVVTTVRQQTGWCPWLLSGCAYIQNHSLCSLCLFLASGFIGHCEGRWWLLVCDSSPRNSFVFVCCWAWTGAF